MPLPISIAYEYFDQKTQLYDNIVTNTRKVKHIHNDNDLEMTKMELYDDDNKKLLLSCNVSVIATYDESLSLWQWGWSLAFYTKSENYIARKLLQYAFDIDTHSESDVYSAAIFKSELLNSKIHLQWPNIETEKLIAISMYLTKSDYYHMVDIQNTEVDATKPTTITTVYYLMKDIQLF